ncbi:MAG: hypothetical protein RL238_1599 [Actinomycetota bacterium]
MRAYVGGVSGSHPAGPHTGGCDFVYNVRMRIARTFAAVALVVLAAACSAERDTDGALPFQDPIPDPSTSLDTGIGWLVNLYDEQACFQVTDGTLASGCLPLSSLTTRGLRYEGSGTQLLMYLVTDEEIGFGEWKSEQMSLAKAFVDVTPDAHLGVFPINGDDSAIEVRLLDDLAEPVRTVDLRDL